MAAALAHRSRHHPGGGWDEESGWEEWDTARGGVDPRHSPPQASAFSCRGRRKRSNDTAPADRACKLVLFVVVLCLGAVALVMRRNGADAGTAEFGAVLQRPRLQPSEGDSMPHPRSFGAASKGAAGDRLDGTSHEARVKEAPAQQAEVAARGVAPVEDVKPATSFTVDGAPARAGEQPRARRDSGASVESQQPRFSVDGEAAAESSRPRVGVSGGTARVPAPKPRFDVNGEVADAAAQPVAKARFGVNGEVAEVATPRFGVNGEAAEAATPRFGVDGQETVAEKQPRFGVNGEAHADEAAPPPATRVAEAHTDRSRKVPALSLGARSKVPVAGAELPVRKKGDSFGLDSDEPAVVTPARTKASGILTANKAQPAETLSPEEDPEPPHLLGEIHEKLSLHTDQRLSHFDELMAANDPRTDRSSDIKPRSSSDRDSAPESSPASGLGGVDPAVLWKPKEKPAAEASSSRPRVDEEQPQPGLQAHEVDTDRFPFLDAADLLDGHPRRSEHDQLTGYKGKAIVERSL